jgi:hypothetical protein
VAFTAEYQRKLKLFEEGDGTTTKKPRKTNFPQQQYACSCHTMRTYHGDSMPSSSMFVSPRGSWPLGETFETRPTWILGRRESATIATPSGKVFLICILDLQ